MLIRRVFVQLKQRKTDFHRFIATSSVPKQSTIETDESEHDAELNEKLLRVAIVGSPNAGKSTLINALMDRKVSCC